jgi:protein arginine kinase
VDRNSSLYAVAHIALFGESETDTLAELEDFTLRLVHYEREARKVLVDRHADELADTALRALGTLQYARRLTPEEAAELLSTVRLGVALELIGEVGLTDVTDALFMCRSSQVGILEMKDDTVSMEAARADLIRKILGRTENV